MSLLKPSIANPLSSPVGMMKVGGSTSKGLVTKHVRHGSLQPTPETLAEEAGPIWSDPEITLPAEPESPGVTSYCPVTLGGAIMVCLSLGTVLHVIGLSTTAWSSVWRYREGLWESCTCDKHKNMPEWFRSSQVLLAMGMAVVVMATLVAIMHIWLQRFNKNITLTILTVICFVACFFLMVGLTTYSVNRDHLNRSFYMTLLACLFTLVAGFISALHLRKAKGV